MYHLSKQNSQDHQHSGWKTLKPIHCNTNEIIGDMKRTKIRQTKTGEPTESPETKSKEQSKKRKLNFTEVLSSKNSKEIWKVIHCILNPNTSTLQADPSALNEFFNKTAERLVMRNVTTDGVILSHIDSLTSCHDRLELQKVTYNDIVKSLKSLRNDC